jgi:hypothetical protein
MKTRLFNQRLALALVSITAALVLPARAQGEEEDLNRFSALTRFGFNMSVRFKGLNAAPLLQGPRTAPGGQHYNYEDGYLLTDASGNHGHQTWFWGYDDSSRQVSGNNILLSRDTLKTPSTSLDDLPSFGGELVYTRMLGRIDRWRYGFEIAANYLNVSVYDDSRSAASLKHTTDAYPYTPGTSPPEATPSAPYQGSRKGPGFVVGDSPNSSSTPVPGAATAVGRHKFVGDLWGFRLGPYLEFPVTPEFKLSLSGGLAGGLMDAEVSWTEKVTLNGVSAGSLHGGGNDCDMLWGAYAAVNATWELDRHWSLVSSVQFQYLENYRHSFSGRTVEAKLNNAFFVNIGIGYRF